MDKSFGVDIYGTSLICGCFERRLSLVSLRLATSPLTWLFQKSLMVNVRRGRLTRC